MFRFKQYIALLVVATTVAMLPHAATADTLKSLNTLTFRPTSQSLRGKNKPIEQLVQTIYENDTVPKKTWLNINDEQYLAQPGVQITPEDNTVFIFSRGYAKRKKPTPKDFFIQRGACALAGYLQYQNHIVTDCPLISFDYDDSRKNFSFGQDNDIGALKTVYNAILQKNPNANIIIIGDCCGSKIALEFATQKPKNLKALILLSPFVSAQSIIDHMAKNFHIPTSILHAFMRRGLPNYKPEKDTLFDRLNQIDTNVAIFLGQRKSDVVIPNEEVRKLARILREDGNHNVHGLIVADSSERHSKIYLNKKIQQRVNAFLKQYGFPYNETPLANAC